MPSQHGRRHIEVDADGRMVAAADVEVLDRPGVVRASLHRESGHLPTDTGRRLVDAVLDSPEVRDGHRLEAAVPVGDTDALERVRQRCDDVRTRPAGATVIVEAELRHDAAGAGAP